MPENETETTTPEGVTAPVEEGAELTESAPSEEGAEVAEEVPAEEAAPEAETPVEDTPNDADGQ